MDNWNLRLNNNYYIVFLIKSESQLRDAILDTQMMIEAWSELVALEYSMSGLYNIELERISARVSCASFHMHRRNRKIKEFD